MWSNVLRRVAKGPGAGAKPRVPQIAFARTERVVGMCRKRRKERERENKGGESKRRSSYSACRSSERVVRALTYLLGLFLSLTPLPTYILPAFSSSPPFRNSFLLASIYIVYKHTPHYTRPRASGFHRVDLSSGSFYESPPSLHSLPCSYNKDMHIGVLLPISPRPLKNFTRFTPMLAALIPTSRKSLCLKKPKHNSKNRTQACQLRLSFGRVSIGSLPEKFEIIEWVGRRLWKRRSWREPPARFIVKQKKM